MKFDFELKYKLLDIFFYSWYSPIEMVYQNIIRIIQYIPLLWSDRDWDQAFLLEMLAFKLKRMSDYHKKYGHAVRSDVTARQLKICSVLAYRLNRDRYCEKEYDDHFKQFPRGDDFFAFLKRSMTEKEHKDIKRIYEKERYLRQYDKDMLFGMLNKHMDGFWD